MCFTRNWSHLSSLESPLQTFLFSYWRDHGYWRLLDWSPRLKSPYQNQIELLKTYKATSEYYILTFPCFCSSRPDCASRLHFSYQVVSLVWSQRLPLHDAKVCPILDRGRWKPEHMLDLIGSLRRSLVEQKGVCPLRSFHGWFLNDEVLKHYWATIRKPSNSLPLLDRVCFVYHNKKPCYSTPWSGHHQARWLCCSHRLLFRNPLFFYTRSLYCGRSRPYCLRV